MKRNNNGNGKKANKRQKKSQIPFVLAQPNRTIVAPRAQSKYMRNSFEVRSGSMRGSVRVSGQDWLGRVAVGAAPATGQVLLEQWINPLDLTGTRLSLFAQMYDKYRFSRLRFEFVPSASTTSRGSLIMAYDRDISDDTPPETDAGIRQYMSFQDSVAGPFWGPLECDCPLSHPEEGLFTNPVAGGDDRLAYQGQFYIVIMEPPVAPNETMGDVYVHYDVELFDPQLDSQAPQLSAAAEAAQVNFGPSANDALRSFVNAAPGIISSLSAAGLIPKLDQSGKAYLDLAQGVYKIYSSLASGQTIAGAVSFATPTVVANVPKPAPAPQPAIVNLVQSDASSVGNPLGVPQYSNEDYTVTVPPGGAKLYATYDDLTGWLNSAGNLQYLKVDQLSKYWAPAASLV